MISVTPPAIIGNKVVCLAVQGFGQVTHRIERPLPENPKKWEIEEAKKQAVKACWDHHMKDLKPSRN